MDTFFAAAGRSAYSPPVNGLVSNNASKSDRFDPKTPLEPEPYREKDIKREIGFTEREINGLLAKNTDLAKKLAIDLSDDLISVKLLLPAGHIGKAHQALSSVYPNSFT